MKGFTKQYFRHNRPQCDPYLYKKTLFNIIERDLGIVNTSLSSTEVDLEQNSTRIFYEINEISLTKQYFSFTLSNTAE